MQIQKIIEREKLLDYLTKRNLLEQYKKAKENSVLWIIVNDAQLETSYYSSTVYFMDLHRNFAQSSFTIALDQKTLVFQ